MSNMLKYADAQTKIWKNTLKKKKKVTIFKTGEFMGVLELGMEVIYKENVS